MRIRLNLLIAVSLLWLMCWIVFETSAQTRLTVQGSGRLYPIAVPQLCVSQGENRAAKDIPKIMARNLDISGYFDVLNPNSFIEAPGTCTGPDDFAYSDWSVLGVEGLVRGVVTNLSDRMRVQLFLHDVHIKRVVLAKEYSGTPSQIRNIANRFSNEVVRFFTGAPGIFGSKIVFSSKVGRFKELFLMEMDGSNLRQLTSDKGLAISAAWSPTGDSVVYTTYRKRVPDLYILNLGNKQASRLTSASALELGGKFSKDGNTIIASLSHGRNTDIALLNRRGVVTKYLTRKNGAIDVSPDWSPDGSQVVYCSNRVGGPQIFTMDINGRNIKRISYVGSPYCTSPVWSPLGDKIAFVCRANYGHQLFVSDVDGGNAYQLTDAGKNEDPSWSPDGRYLVFATSLYSRGNIFNLAMIRSDGGKLHRLTSGRSGDTSPAWGPIVE